MFASNKSAANKNFWHLVFIALMLCGPGSSLLGQEFINYSQESLSIESKFLGRALEIEMSVPDDYTLAGESYQIPLIILFDRQNETSYRYHLKSINFLLGVGSQIPNCLVAGVPFDNEFRNMMTSPNNVDGKELSGIEETEFFLFEELIPKLRADYPGISSVIIIGHSRTGYLVNYLMAKRMDEFDAGISCSGFYSDSMTTEFFEKLPLSDLSSRKRSFSYYMSAGDTYIEQNYLIPFQSMADSWKDAPTNPFFKWKLMIFPEAGHFTNFAMTVPPALVDLFADYSHVLMDGFETEFKTDGDAFQEYLDKMAQLNIPCSPPTLHINSIGSHFMNYGDFDMAMRFIELGKEIYANDPGYDLFAAEIAKSAGNLADFDRFIKDYEQSIKLATHLKPEYHEELKEWHAYLLE